MTYCRIRNRQGWCMFDRRITRSRTANVSMLYSTQKTHLYRHGWVILQSSYGSKIRTRKHDAGRARTLLWSRSTHNTNQQESFYGTRKQLLTKKKQQSNSVNQQQRSRILTSGRKKTSASNSSRSGTYRFAAFSTSDQEAERHAPMVGNNNGRTEGNSFMQVHQTDAERLSSDDFTRRRRKMSTAS